MKLSSRVTTRSGSESGTSLRRRGRGGGPATSRPSAGDRARRACGTIDAPVRLVRGAREHSRGRQTPAGTRNALSASLNACPASSFSIGLRALELARERRRRLAFARIRLEQPVEDPPHIAGYGPAARSSNSSSISKPIRRARRYWARPVGRDRVRLKVFLHLQAVLHVAQKA